MAYIDKLFEVLKATGIGCYVGSTFAGAIGYADDIVLLSPSITGLQRLIDLTSHFLTDRSLLLNAKKSQFIVFRKTSFDQNCTVKLNGEQIQPIDSVNYLGHLFESNCSDAADIQKTCIRIISSGFPLVEFGSIRNCVF